MGGSGTFDANARYAAFEIARGFGYLNRGDQAAPVGRVGREAWNHRSTKLDGTGHLYVIQFGNDVVKIGITSDPPRRLQQHLNDAAAFGTHIAATWISHAHADYAKIERFVIGVAAKALRNQQVRREYFRSASFDGMVHLVRTATSEEGRGVLTAVLHGADGGEEAHTFTPLP